MRLVTEENKKNEGTVRSTLISVHDVSLLIDAHCPWYSFVLIYLLFISGVSLAVSLHAPTDALRTRIMAINKTYPLEILMDACRRYCGEAEHSLLGKEYKKCTRSVMCVLCFSVPWHDMLCDWSATFLYSILPPVFCSWSFKRELTLIYLLTLDMFFSSFITMSR